MKIREIVKILDCKVLVGEDYLDNEVNAGCGCDLMSDVLAFIETNSILLTGLNNIQAIRTAEIAEIKAICFVRGKHPSEEMKKLAEVKEIILLSTTLPLFVACGKLYMKGLVGSFYKGT
jgi:predicted transcriptional regulator